MSPEATDVEPADPDGVELFDPDIPRVDAVFGPATGIQFLIMKSATSPTGAPPMAPQSATLPLAISDLMDQLTQAWKSWQDGLVHPADPDQTTADAAAVTKALRSRRGAGADEARWTDMLGRVDPVRSLEIRSTVARGALSLARNMGITTSEAVKITKGLCVAAEPKVRRSEGAALNALAAALRPGNARRL